MFLEKKVLIIYNFLTYYYKLAKKNFMEYKLIKYKSAIFKDIVVMGKVIRIIVPLGA